MNEKLARTPEREGILARHGGPAPRYVAYPSPNLWTSPPPSGERIRRLRSIYRGGGTIDLYIHVPFCSKLCFYCGCKTEIRPPKPEYGNRFLDSLRTELDRLSTCSGGLPWVRSLHIGGGTPTFLNHEQLTKLGNLLQRFLNFTPDSELSFESNPETVTTDRLSVLREKGFSRISLGIQDFDQDTQWAINRFHPFTQVRSVVESCREIGFSSINFDLIHGLPHQTVERFEKTVEKTIALNPERVALYNFAYVPEKMPHQKKIDPKTLPSPMENWNIFERASDLFSANEYRSIGMDHFTKPNDPLTLAFDNNRLKRNFMGYVEHSSENLLGIGPGAISFLEGAYLRNTPSLVLWSNALEKGGFGQDLWCEQTEMDRKRHSIINDFLCHLTINDENFVTATETDASRIASQLESFVIDGILERTNNQRAWTLTRFGRPFARAVACLFDTRLGAEGADSRYSKVA
ncbi:MAG: oxygen-independent coproporphyrinogen III oxidase [Opitutae bacterium]|nr:oxygen-independent coproporphyrinogen III oxidase [Opitutae bacterium]